MLKRTQVAEAFKEASQRVGEGKLQLAHARPHAQGYDINTRNDLTTFIKPKEGTIVLVTLPI